MGNCFSPKKRVSPRDMYRDREWTDEQEKRVWRVKVRLTAKELEELLLQAQSGGTMGPELLCMCIMKGRLEVKELVQGDGGGRGQKKKKNNLEAIKEDEI